MNCNIHKAWDLILHFKAITCHFMVIPAGLWNLNRSSKKRPGFKHSSGSFISIIVRYHLCVIKNKKTTSSIEEVDCQEVQKNKQREWSSEMVTLPLDKHPNPCIHLTIETLTKTIQSDWLIKTLFKP